MNTITTLLKKQYTDETHNIYNADKRKSYNTKNNKYTDEHYYNKKQLITSNLTNYITQRNSITNTENVSNIKKDFSTTHYITNVFRSNHDYIENHLYKRSDNRIFNNTNNITKHINNHSNGATNNYKANKINNVKTTYYNFSCDITLNKTSNKYLMTHTV